jgi:hypothetical protein
MKFNGILDNYPGWLIALHIGAVTLSIFAIIGV